MLYTTMSNMKDCDYGETSEDDSGDEEQKEVSDSSPVSHCGGADKNEVFGGDAAPKAPCNNIIISGKVLKDKEVIPIAREWMAFMAHIPHADADEIRQDLERLETKYIMGLEVSSYEHIHFLALMTNKEYHAFSKKHFKEKRKLRGRAVKGLPRQYGKEKEIRDMEKYTKYCLKDQNFLTNMQKSEIEEIIKMKIDDVKNTKGNDARKELKTRLLEYLEKVNMKPVRSHHPNDDERFAKDWEFRVKVKIIDFMRDENLIIRRSTIDMYYYYVIAYSTNNNYKMSSKEICHQLYYHP